MCRVLGKLAEFLIKLKKVDFKKDDYIIIYSSEKNVYSSFKRSELDNFTCFIDYIKIVGVLRKNVITNEPYFTRWEELSCTEQNILFGIAIHYSDSRCDGESN